MTASGLIIRECEKGDLERVTAIYGRSVREETASFELRAPDLAEMTRRYEALMARSYPYLVAERDREVVGYAYAAEYRSRPGYRHTVEDAVYVDPQAQRSGIGRALLERLIEECEAHGFRQMIAIIGDSAHIPSIELHKALGFTYAGNLESVGYKHGKWLDSVFLQRSLGSGDSAPPERA
jgi:phosphinothricin acetyltransferase